MGLVTMKKLLDDAYENQYAIPAFNFDNFEILMGIFQGAEIAKSPVIVQITEPAIQWLGVENVVSVVRNEANKNGLTVALHLDHADNLDLIKTCIKAGFTSVMIDSSDKTIKENMETTKQVVDIAKQYNVTVESELGFVSTADKIENQFTDAQQASMFCDYTGIDVLGVSIGNTHGMKRRTVRLNLERLSELNNRLNLPLVLHGSSGVDKKDLIDAVNLGITKVNTETELRCAFRKSLDEVLLENPTEIKPRNIMLRVRESIKDHTVELYNYLKSANKNSNFEHKK